MLTCVTVKGLYVMAKRLTCVTVKGLEFLGKKAYLCQSKIICLSWQNGLTGVIVKGPMYVILKGPVYAIVKGCICIIVKLYMSMLW